MNERRDDPLSSEQQPVDPVAYRARQRSRAKVMALLLLAFVVLMFFITMAKIKAGMG